MTAQNLVDQLQLLPHPEGGFYKETYRATETISAEALPAKFKGPRNFSTAIYYLLQQGDFSAFHRIESDECWHFYSGGALLIHCLSMEGAYSCIKLGNNIGEGEVFQHVVTAQTWFAAEPAAGSAYCLAGCTVAPGFDFKDFTMADEQTMIKKYPEQASLIKRLCRI